VSETLDEVIAEGRGEASVLASHGHHGQAKTLELFVERVVAAARPYLTWLSDAEAKLRSGKSVDWLRARFPAWEAAGLAKTVGRTRYYRELVIPVRAHEDEARELGRRGERRKRA
jgi:hypothetical protein